TRTATQALIFTCNDFRIILPPVWRCAKIDFHLSPVFFYYNVSGAHFQAYYGNWFQRRAKK
ncbi:MAG: hypothetical protein J1E98_13805, partial [Lachnospiraceae bacterium]|nr:hypothetical protein [Lachnospiraceae bacterium]